MADDTITAPLRAHARLYDRRIHAALDFPEKLVELWPEIADALDAADELREYAEAAEGYYTTGGMKVARPPWLNPTAAREIVRRLAPVGNLRAAIAREVKS